MMRDAKYVDIPALVAMLKRVHAKSKYADRAEVHDKSVEELLLGAVAGQKHRGPNGSYLAVIERDDKIVAFIVGSLSRAYNILDKLVADDIFLISESNRPVDIIRLIDGYVGWAGSNPNVIEIGLSWSDAVNDGQTMAKLYQRKGFRLAGEQYDLRTDGAEQEAA